MEFIDIEYRVENKIAHITLNRPQVLNAMTNAMGTELLKAFTLAQQEARVVLLGANGRGFCAGADLASDEMKLDDANRDAGIGLEFPFNPLMLAMRDLEIPIVNAVKGCAAGIGCSLALMGDIIIAGKGTFFLQAFRNVGLVPDGGSAYLLAKSVGRAKAMEIMLMGKRFYAEDAMKYGLITQIVPDENIDEIAFEYAAELATGPTKALGMIRKLAWSALDNNLERQLLLERNSQRIVGQTTDFPEGVNAFLEKRAPSFGGF